MKFKEKLVKLRKEKNMSQEQLAEELEVSRQAVSKWESGNSYPEMDKLIQMCKIFNCTLDDFTNDEIDLEKIETKNNKNPVNDILFEIKETLKISIDMFSNMKAKEIIKLLFTMFIVLLIVLFLQLPIKELYSSVETVFYSFGDDFGKIASSIWMFVLGAGYIILSIMIFFYIYKFKYLDKYKEIKKSDNIVNENPINNNISKEEIKKENINFGNKSWSLLKLLGKICMFFIKATVIFFTIPFMIIFVLLVFGFIIDIILMFKGVILIGILILIIASIILLIMLFIIIFNFIFNKHIGVKTIFILFMIGLVLLGMGGGITFLEISRYKIINERPSNYEESIIKEEFNWNSDLKVSGYDVSYVVDETLKDKIKIDVVYYKELSTPKIVNHDNYLTVYSMDDEFSFDFINSLIEDLKNKTIYNYSDLTHYKIIIYTSSDNINIMKENTNTSEENYDRYSYEIDKLENENSILQDKLEEKEEELSDLKDKMEEYKSNIKSILED